MENSSRDGDTVLQENLPLGAPATEKSRGKKKKNRLAEFDEFSRQWRISDGFDVCDPPFDLIEGPCIFEDINSLSSDNERVKLAYDCVNFAINYENEHKNLSLKFVELVKFNLDSELGGQMYYLTFKAKDREDREDVYQAKVFMPEEDEEEEEEVDVVEKYKAYIAQFGKSENDFADHTDLEGEEEEEEDIEEDDDEEDEKEVEEEDVEDEKDGEDDEEDEEGDEKDYEGTQEMKVLIFRKKPSRYQKSKGAEKEDGCGKKRCRCGKIKHGCSCGGCST